MRQNQNTNGNTNSKVSNDSFEIMGINQFVSSLEKFFFAEANIKTTFNESCPDLSINIGLNCNFGLTESLFHLNSGNWGGFCKNNSKLEYSGFEQAVTKLQELNSQKIIIEEIAIYFIDTSLFITKIPNQNITDQLCSILGALSENFVHFTKGLTEMPYEIFIPVFEESTDKTYASDDVYGVMSKIRTSYFNYWGLYFYSEVNQDSLVYDLKSKNIIDGDFILLNNE
ncbi:hypothetical protein MTsPCn9_04550 [Croceitalea sp. MTPC9]|uniref:hypothetical protein n=1 Tax=unclassified Croceitalea TaxID=2632280 RepID=UPI002B37E0CD|nr:hypothetical protein MTsPCn6_04160 [Croceitalea sp. MTPC6]GMN15519.1 hypothetical protein MTsPCn9_04550 [Croceitalea sp. MTPC9]